MTVFKKKTELAKGVFWPSYLIGIAVIVLGIANQKPFGSILDAGLNWVSDNFGWWLVLFALILVLLVFGLAFSKAGDVVIGGAGAKPEYTMWQWFSMSLKGVLARVSLLGDGRAIFHMAAPAAAGAQPFTREAGLFAISQTMLHWTIARDVFACAGRSWPTIGAVISKSRSSNYLKWLTRVETVVPMVSLFCIVGALACSMAVGLMQINSGLNFFFGLPIDGVTVFAIAAIMVTVYVVSCLTGIKKGMRVLSSFCTIVFIGLMVYVLCLGPTRFIVDAGTESLGVFFNRFFEHSVILPTMAENETWSKSWIIMFMASFFVYAPIIGLFLARLGKGRTVREFIFMNIGAPTLFCIVWIAIWGGTTVWLQYTGIMDVWQSVNEKGLEVTIFTILSTLPFAKILAAFFIIAVFFSFSTMADSITGTMATLSTKNLSVDDEAPRWLKIIWGVSFGVIGYLLVATGGVDSVRGMFTIVGLPISFIVLAYAYCVIRECGRIAAETLRH
ncbi:MAG: BCCT family transporter [Sutterella wadsworthensis]